MNAANQKIQPLMLMFLFIGFVHGSIMLLSFFDSYMKQDTWIVIIIGYALSIPFILSYISLANKFPGRNIVEIHDIVYGKVFGKLISINYVLFFTVVFALNYRQMVGFYSAYILGDTPPIMIYILFGLLCAYAAKKGIATIAKISFFTVVFAIFAAIFAFLLLTGEMDFTNLLPLGQASVKNFAQGTYTMACIPLCEVVVILMIMPVVDNAHKAKKYVMVGGIIIILIYLLDIVRIIATLGPSSVIYMESSFHSVRLISIREFFTRMELIIALGLVASIFIKTSVLNYAVVKSTAQLLKLKSYAPLLLPFIGIGIIFAMNAFDASVEYADNANRQIIYALPFEFILPVLTLLIAKIRRLPYKGGVAV